MAFIRNISMMLIVLVAWKYYVHNYPKTLQPPQLNGYFHPSFQKVADTFRKNLESGFERGAAFAVYHKGERLVDLWGGWADIGSERHWQEDTMATSYSMVKGVSAIVVARLVDMGLLDYKKEVYHYWPEFGTADKKNVTVEMLFSHQAGLIGFDEKVSLYDIRDRWEKVENIMAKQAPAWPPGTAVGYHGISFGMFADALVRKVDPKHRNISQFFQDEIAKPLDIEFYIGLPKEKYHRFARGQEASLWELRFNIFEITPILMSPYFKLMHIWDHKIYEFNNPDLLAIGHPSALGFGPARSLAKLYDFIANGGSVKAKRLLSPEIVKALREPLTENIPNVFLLRKPVSRGLILFRNRQDHECIGHPGYGGNQAFADMDAGLGITYSTNHLGGYFTRDPREVSLMDAFYECFENYKAQKTTRRGV